MSDKTGISWTDATWNPVIGCTKVSAGCDNCYAIRTARRMTANPNPLVSQAYAGTEAGGEWTGKVNLLANRLDQPLRWRKPRRIFVNAQSDLFHKEVPDDFIARVFAVMALAPQHTFQVLTKRHGRMRSLLSSEDFPRLVFAHAYHNGAEDIGDADWGHEDWPLSNVWVGVSVEDQATADLRIPALLDTPAAVRLLSCEPLLGPMDLQMAVPRPCTCGPGQTFLIGETRAHKTGCPALRWPFPDWVIVGGESGPGARPMHPDWARSLRDQCAPVGVPYFFKQWGEHGPDGRRVGRRATGDLLDGVLHREWPVSQ